MQRPFLLSTAALCAVLLLSLLPSFQTAQAQTESVLYNMCGVGFCWDGSSPSASLAGFTYGTSLTLYGTTQSGGYGGPCSIICWGGVAGTIFQLTQEPSTGCPTGTNAGNSWCEQAIYSFCAGGNYPYCPDGVSPSTNLMFVGTGTFSNLIYNLYGTTYNGGSGANCSDPNGCGVAFDLTPVPLPSGVCPSGTTAGNGWCETVIYNFCSLAGCADGSYPTSGMVRDSSGNFYGANSNGVFELYRDSGVWKEAMIYSVPMLYGGLTIDSAGNLYGIDNNGNVFKLYRDLIGLWLATNIHSFPASAKDGLYPSGAPAVDSAGNVYGTTSNGGAGTTCNSVGCGTVWKLTPVTTGTEAGTYKERILHSFNSQKTGDYPTSGVTLDSAGNLYGTTQTGGPYYNLTQCQYSGEPNGCGTVFKLAVSGDTYEYKLLWSFNSTNGALPFANPILDNSGNLYGTTYGGGTFNVGAVFEVNPSGPTTTTVLTSSPNPSTVGEAVTFTATVTTSTGAPPDIANVTFMKGTTVLGTASLVDGSASFTITSLPLGASKVDAVYSGDLNFAPSTSNTVRQSVERE